MFEEKKILILGIGAIGGVIAGKLLLAKVDCTLITNNEKITNQIKNDGLIINESMQSKINPIVLHPLKIFTSLYSVTDKFDYIFFTMKATQIEKSLIQAKPFLKNNGFVVSFQNGIVMDYFYNYYADSVIIGIIIFNSEMIKPGFYSISKSEKIIIGKAHTSQIDNSLVHLKNILSNVTTCVISENIVGICWSKLAINCSINAITGVSGLKLGPILKNKIGRELFLQIYKETVDIAHKLNIKLAKIKIDPLMLYQDENTSFYKKSIQMILINQISKNYAEINPSMLQDIKNKRKTEIRFLNGFISYLGNELNVSTPINREMTMLIINIELDFLKPDFAHLRNVHESFLEKKSSQTISI